MNKHCGAEVCMECKFPW